MNKESCEKLCRVFKKLKSMEFFKKNYLVFLIGFFLNPFLYLYLLQWVANRDYQTILPAVAGFIFVLIIFLVTIILSEKIRAWINKNGSLTNLLLVLITIFLTFAVYYVSLLNDYYKINTSLVAANSLNLRFANDFLQDKENKWNYWTYFLTSPYEQNLPFILKNFNDSCSRDYLFLMAEMQILNEVNRNTNENSAWFNFPENPSSLIVQENMFKSRKKEITERASTTKTNLEKILKECHNTKIESQT